MRALEAEIRGALRSVHDPCSVASNMPLNVLDMGLVRDWRLAARRLDVRLVLTSVACFHVSAIVAAIEQQLGTLDGIDSVTVTIDHGTLWGPELMSDRAREAVARRRRRTLELTGARPQQWREQRSPQRPATTAPPGVR
jgi:metal-sulfur cluster biosynthetic enzyme